MDGRIVRSSIGLFPKKQIDKQPAGENDFDQYSVNACADVTLLIPGYRLWRNSVVTLGSQTADEIRVMPNMEGISAVFRQVRVPSFNPENAPAGASGPAHVKLRVWTSEGVAELARPLDVGIPAEAPPGGSCKATGPAP